MRIVVPTDGDGNPIISHTMPLNSVTMVPVLKGDDGHHYVHVNQRRWHGLITGQHGLLWKRANPNVTFETEARF